MWGVKAMKDRRDIELQLAKRDLYDRLKRAGADTIPSVVQALEDGELLKRLGIPDSYELAVETLHAEFSKLLQPYC